MSPSRRASRSRRCPRCSTTGTACPPRPASASSQSSRELGYEASLGRAEPAQPHAPTSSASWSPTSSRSAPSCSRAPRRPSRARATSCSSTPPADAPATRSAGSSATCRGWPARSSTAPSWSRPRWSTSPTEVPYVAVDPHTGPARPADRRLGQPQRRPRRGTEHLLVWGTAASRMIAGRPDLESARLREEGFRAGPATSPASTVDPDLIQRRRLRPGLSPTAPPASCSAEPTGPPRSSPRTTSRRSQRSRSPTSSGSGCPTTCRSSASTTCPSRCWPSHRSLRSTSRSRRWADCPSRSCCKLMAGEEPDELHVTLPTELVVRQSTGPVNGP